MRLGVEKDPSTGPIVCANSANPKLLPSGPRAFPSTRRISSTRHPKRILASIRFGCLVEDIRLVDGKALGPDGKSLGFAEFAQTIGPVDGSFSTPKRTYSYGAHAAHVTVDLATGAVKVLSYVAVEDVGQHLQPQHRTKLSLRPSLDQP